MSTKPCLLRDKHLVEEYFGNHYNTKKSEKINVIDILMGSKAKSSRLRILLKIYEIVMVACL